MWRAIRNLVTVFRRKNKDVFAAEFSPDNLITFLQKYFNTTADEKLCINRISESFFSRYFVSDERIIFLAKNLSSEKHPWRLRLYKEMDALYSGVSMNNLESKLLDEQWSFEKPLNGENTSDILLQLKAHRMALVPRLALGLIYKDIQQEQIQSYLKAWIDFVTNQGSEYPYFSTLVVIQRLFSLSWAIAFVAADNRQSNVMLLATLFEIVRVDIDYLMPRLGRSFQNNHLLVDYFAGWYICHVFPEFVKDPGQAAVYESKWIGELMRQTLDDGTGFEQSVHYHEFGCEMAVAYMFLKQRRGEQIPDKVRTRIEYMLKFQSDLAGPHLMPPAIGNATEDPLFPLYSPAGSAAGAWRCLYHNLFAGEGGIGSKRDHSVEWAYWISGGAIEPSEKVEVGESSLVAYTDGGYFVLNDSVSGLRTLFRTGPAKRCLVICGHAHADILTVTQSYSDQWILMDPGTLTYRYGKKDFGYGIANWRAYFSGPESHNGLCIEGIDPLNRLEGDFRETLCQTTIKTVVDSHKNFGVLVRGTASSESPIAGYTRTLLQINGEYTIICDDLAKSEDVGCVWYSFQFGPGLALTLAGDRQVVLRLGDRKWNLVGDVKLGPAKILRGSLDPIGGWVSPAYGRLELAPQVKFLAPKDGLNAIVMGFLPESRGSYWVESDRLDGGWVVQVAQGGMQDIVIINSEKVKKTLKWSNIIFQGEALWLRNLLGNCTDIRGLNVGYLKVDEEVLIHKNGTSFSGRLYG